MIPSRSELSTQQAADTLNVSRPYLIDLLESGRIPHRKGGRHRRVPVEALLDYKRHDDAKRREEAGELAEISQDLGLY